MPEPTIIIGSLNDSELKKSIESLVNAVDEGTKKMKSSFDSTIEAMKSKLGELGKTKVDFSSETGSGSSKRATRQKAETQAVNETINSYDQLAMAMKRAEIQANKRYSVNDEMINLRTNLHEVEYQLRLLDKQWASFHPMSRGTDDSYNKYLRELQSNLEKTRGLMATALGPENADKRSALSEKIKAIRDEIAKLEQDRGRFLKNSSMEGPLKAQYEEIQKRIRAIADEYRNAEVAERALMSTAKGYTEEILRQAQAIRENESFKKNGFLFLKGIGTDGKDVNIRSEEFQRASGERKNILSIEEQLLRVQQRKNEELERQAFKQRQAEEAEKAAEQAARQTLNTQQQVTAELKKRKNYVAPELINPFRSLVANKIGLADISQLKQMDGTIKNTTAYMKQLQDAFGRLNAQGRNSDFGKQLREELQMVNRVLQKTRAEALRPISLESALALPKRTIDDIVYKIQQLNSYKRGLDLFDPKQKAEITDIDREINKLNKDLNKYTQTTRQAKDMSNALGRSWNYMKNRLAFYFTVGASTQFVKNLIDIRSQYEMNERALGILINSAERGTQIFNELSQMALVSPYTLIELSAAAKQLTMEPV